MAVRVIVVRRGAGDAYADDADDVRRGVGEGVVAVGQHGDGAGGDAERDLRRGDDQVEEEDAIEDGRDFGCARQKTLACGTGHQRTWTLPMMYFFGTGPHWRLSELLFRWSPIT